VDALASFDQAIAIDPALGPAWLGRGLCRIRQGQSKAGRDDLQVAATLEPNRAVFAAIWAKRSATQAIINAPVANCCWPGNFDPNDPTAWLYSALLAQQDNRVNEAVRDLEQSQALNNNRRVYRSRLCSTGIRRCAAPTSSALSRTRA